MTKNSGLKGWLNVAFLSLLIQTLCAPVILAAEQSLPNIINIITDDTLSLIHI